MVYLHNLPLFLVKNDSQGYIMNFNTALIQDLNNMRSFDKNLGAKMPRQFYPKAVMQVPRVQNVPYKDVRRS